ncbi:MAG TPA: flagellar assembly protein FliW [candidate division Zixibacteria bacterium]|nr:flagellar assembly protein FliW [candidate division Zixibacteria bacterium]
MKIRTIRFGELEIPDEKIITMSKPILGFENLKRYCLIERQDCEPFLWYQSIEDPAAAFPVVNPLLFCPDYKIEVNPREIEELHIRDVKSVETYTIVTIPADPANMTINLQGPILINTETCLAKQLVLVNSGYDVKYYVMRGTSKQDADKQFETAAV